MTNNQTFPLYLLSQLYTELGRSGEQEERATYLKKHIRKEGSLDETANKILDTDKTILHHHWELSNYCKKAAVQYKKI